MSRSVLTEYQVNTEHPVSQPLTIAHISDLHERNSDDILAVVRKVAPDFIVVTGDTFERYDNRPQYDFERRPIKRVILNTIHYTNYLLTKFQRDKTKAKTENAYNFLMQAVKIAPVYLSLGNHEQMLLDVDYFFLKDCGVTLLDNASTHIRYKGCDILLGGISTWNYETFIEQFLSGHTHGGQIRVGKKGRGFFVPGQGLFGKYAHGSFFDNKLIVSAGCANTVMCPRFGNPRELVVIRLKGKQS